MLSQKAKYALRALMVLADRKTGDPMQLREIATAEKLPHKSSWKRRCWSCANTVFSKAGAGAAAAIGWRAPRI
jgi:hypothetical protein